MSSPNLFTYLKSRSNPFSPFSSGKTLINVADSLKVESVIFGIELAHQNQSEVNIIISESKLEGVVSV